MTTRVKKMGIWVKPERSHDKINGWTNFHSFSKTKMSEYYTEQRVKKLVKNEWKKLVKTSES